MKRMITSLVLTGMIVGAAPNVFPINEVKAAQSINNLVSGSSYNAKWLDEQHILFTNEKNEISSTYLLNVQTKQVKKQFNQSELTISPNGKQAIYSDDKDALFLLDIQSSKSTLLTNDDSFKSDFVWSNDGSKIFFLQGDKGETVSSISVKDGSITKILDDKVEYKSDLRLSTDETKILYLAAKQAETKYTDDKKTDVDTIVTEGTEPQLFEFNLASSKPESVIITSSKENKFFITPLQNGRILYLEVSPEDDGKLPILKLTSPDRKTINNLVENMEIEGVTVSSNGGIYILVKEKDSSSSIYKVSTSGSLERKINTKQEITSLEVSKEGKQIVTTIATDNGDKLAIFKDKRLEELTKN
ncbi:TolB family protein [Bacillus sp. CGMCC 1.16607]|uniref:TolB family protein n=1 Tax=Bacillus sp. CGMCC 1.16607 TaxID=3351842 RepID=UPI00362860FF